MMSSSLGFASETLAPATTIDDQNRADEASSDKLVPTSKVHYSTSIALESKDEKLYELLERTSRLKSLERDPPFSIAHLHRRASTDLELLRKVLRSEGYYGSSLHYTIGTDEKVSTAKAEVRLEIDQGTRYKIEKIETALSGTSAVRSDLHDKIEQLQVYTDKPARAKNIVEFEKVVIQFLSQNGFPNAALSRRQVFVVHSTQTMNAQMLFETGPELVFGDMIVRGNEHIEERFIKTFQSWEVGEIYDYKKIEDLRSALYQTGHFQTIDIEFVDNSSDEASGERAVVVKVRESKRRSIGAGVLVSSSDGVGANAFWENRNLLGRGEELRADIFATTLEQRAGIKFSRPNFRRKAQILQLNAAVGREDSDAYNELSLLVGAGVNRPWVRNWKVSLGTEAELLQVKQDQVKDTFQLFSVAGRLSQDTTDDPLDPTKGSRLLVKATPYLSLGSGTKYFIITEASGSLYQSLGKSVVLASRARLGAITGASISAIPASKRFYAGGGRSIRGYDYQMVGPLDADDNDPTGGRSVVEINFEPRIRVSEKISVIPFVDAGYVSEDSIPDFSSGLQVGAGLGVAYMTPVGPIRVDLARALNRRKGIDSNFEFYISLGQAF